MPNPTKTQAIKAFLLAKAPRDLADLYNEGMECQVNVAQDGGTRVEGDFKGRQWHGWTDGILTWKSFRVPFNAKSEPHYTDSEIKFDLAEHVEGIGMTGWNWKERRSKWVAFDFDSITGHSDKHAAKLAVDQMQAVQDAASKIEWVTVRKSTSGKGLHLYIFCDVPTANHNEHAALARAILGMMAAITGFDFSSKVDICGGNMWCWHRRMTPDGYQLIKAGTRLTEPPPNWRDHVKVVTGSRRKNLPQFIEEIPDADRMFEELTGQRQRTPLDDEHNKLISYLKDRNLLWWWDNDHWMLVTHTYHLQNAHKDLALRGTFKTAAAGTQAPTDHNCFLFPMRRGAWAVRRYSIGVQEAESWEQDGAGWTRCYLNKEPDLPTAARTHGGVEQKSGQFAFTEAESAVQAAAALGAHIKLPGWAQGRTTKMKEHRDGRLIVEIEHRANDQPADMAGWYAEKGNWTRIYNVQLAAPSEPDVGNFDDLVRHIVTEQNDGYGWVVKRENSWGNEDKSEVFTALLSLGLKQKEAVNVLGGSIWKPWIIVNRPFQPEYPGNRAWNRNAAQYKFLPAQKTDSLDYPTWLKLLKHIGGGLDSAISENAWAQANGILTGADYLKVWIASLLQEPLQPLPYLFLHGPQNSGKSSLHEAISLLITCGYQRADAALISQSNFNGELENAILCIVEETDLRKNRNAYNRIKDWVTSRHLPIHRKQKTPYHVPNSTHWIQCANDAAACPIFTGDTRITIIHVPNIDPTELIPKKILIPQLEKEAPDFMAELLNLEIPPSNDRLNVPVIETDEKSQLAAMNQSELERFLVEVCHSVPGEKIKFSELCERFHEWLDPNSISLWSKIRVGRELPAEHPKGRSMQDGGQFFVCNISFKARPSADPIKPRLKVVKEKIVSE